MAPVAAQQQEGLINVNVSDVDVGVIAKAARATRPDKHLRPGYENLTRILET